MTAYFTTPIRALLLAAALAFAGQTVGAAGSTPEQTATARTTTARTKTDAAVAEPDDSSLGGVLIIVGIVGVVVVVAWVCSRIGDNRSHVIG